MPQDPKNTSAHPPLDSLQLLTDLTSADAVTPLGDWVDPKLLSQLSAAAQSADKKLMLLTIATSPEAQRLLAKRRHDIKAALRTLSFVVQALERGYKFDDDVAIAKIEAIAKAVQVLDKEHDLLLRSLDG